MLHSDDTFGKINNDAEQGYVLGVSEYENSVKRVVESRAPPPFFVHTGNKNVGQRKTTGEEVVPETTLDTKRQFAMIDSPPENNPSKNTVAVAYPQPFQLMVNAANPPIQYKSPPPLVKGGKITVKPEDATNVVSGTYDQISNQLSQGAEAGSVISILPEMINFNDNPGGKSISTSFTVRIVKTMPKWAEYGSIKASLPKLQATVNQLEKELKDTSLSQDDRSKKEKEKEETQIEINYRKRILVAWDSVYASIDAHENKHRSDEVAIYNALLQKIQGKTENDAMKLINGAGDEGQTKSDEWHDDEKSKIIKWPIVERKPTKVP